MRSLDSARLLYGHLQRFGTLDEWKNDKIISSFKERDAHFSRSLLWKACLLGTASDIPRWHSQLSDTRESYDALRRRYVQPLQHTDELDSSDDPLSGSSSSQWNGIRSDEALRREIYQDVERCMPDNLYFQQPETEALLVDILFIWAKLNSDISYRQGMHEIVAPVLWVVERDAVNPQTTPREPNDEDEQVLSMFAAENIEHDTFTLFNAIMSVLKPAFEHASAGKASGPANTDVGSRCSRILDVYIADTDPALADHLSELQLVPQVFLLRWIRLLFGREFTFDQTLLLWDSMFATDYSSQTIDLICVVMILRLRWRLLEADYNSALQLLMKYPASGLGEGVTSLVEDAVYLKTHLDADGGSHIISKRTGRPPPVVDRPRTPTPSQPPSARPYSPTVSTRPHRLGQVPGGLESLLQDATRGLYTRGERLGLNQAVRDVVVEVKKNVQNVQSRTHSRTTSRSQMIEHTAEGQGSESPQVRLTGLQSRNQALAKMLDAAVATLWEGQRNGQDAKAGSEEQVQAMTAAIAKVQFVQIYLADPTLALPVETSPQKADVSAGTNEMKPNESETGSRIEAPASDNAQNQRVDAPPEGPREKTDVGTAEVADGQVIEQSTASKRSTARPKTSAALKPSRPALEQSSFSWMLGQESSPSGSARRTFMSASPFKEGSYRGSFSARGSNAFLFGDDQEDPFAKPGTESKPQDKAGKGADEKDEPLRLGTIKSKPGAQK